MKLRPTRGKTGRNRLSIVERGELDLSTLPGGLDLRATVESGQSYLWWRTDGETYTEGGDGATYRTTDRVDGVPVVIEAERVADKLRWRATGDAAPVLRRRLGLDDDLPAIRASTPSDDLIDSAWEASWGMRIVRDPPVPTLVSFICSTQMRVERIFEMQQSLRTALGAELAFGGETVHAFPTPERLAAAGETKLRDLGLGYRAPYVQETARMVADGEAHPADATDLPYEEARECLTRFVGVGDKVADCVLLFGLGELSAVPLDTWIQRTVREYYPDLEGDSYAETSRAIREHLGPYAGYAQTYVFHYRRAGLGPETTA
jgi:N-glycosylase/DNA lyase